jgi:hypothetical protein
MGKPGYCTGPNLRLVAYQLVDLILFGAFIFITSTLVLEYLKCSYFKDMAVKSEESADQATFWSLANAVLGPTKLGLKVAGHSATYFSQNAK